MKISYSTKFFAYGNGAIDGTQGYQHSNICGYGFGATLSGASGEGLGYRCGEGFGECNTSGEDRMGTGSSKGCGGIRGEILYGIGSGSSIGDSR